MPRGFGGGFGGGGMGGGGNRAAAHMRLDDVDGAELRSSRQRFDAYRRRWRSRKDAWSQSRKRGRDAPRAHVGRYVTWLRPFWRLIAGVMVLGLVIAGMDALRPIFIGEMINAVTGAENYVLADYFAGWEPLDILGVLGISALVVLLASRVIGLVRNVLMIQLGMSTAHRLRSQLYDRFIHLSASELHDLKSGGVISRLSTDVDHTTDLVNRGVIQPVMAIVRLVIVVAVMLWYSWPVTLLAMTMLTVMAVIHHLTMRRIRPIFRSMGSDRASIDGRVAETFGGIRVVRSFARETHESLDYAVGHHTVIRKQVWARLLMHVCGMFWEILTPLVGLVVIWVGGYYILDGQLNIGEVVAVQMLAGQILHPVTQIVQSMTETQRSLASMDRVYEVLDKQNEKPDRPDALPAPTAVGELQFKQVWFNYSAELAELQPQPADDESWALKDLNLTIPGGATVALVGHSGAGKSTIADLVARFHDPTTGAVTLNGVDLRDYRLHDYRELLGVVQQETFLFDGSIRDNIRYGRRDATDAEVEDAARRANAMEFIEPMADGLDSIIGERGVKLSGGQRQRLSIARAILADPKILVLDEATSNLDTQSEQLIQQSIDELLKGRTTIIVAHRLSTIQRADLIVVLDHGRLIEQGTHAELIKQGGMYAEMVERQRSDQVDGLVERAML